MTSRADPSWFQGLGLGLFIHWGHASTRGWELSWQMTGGVQGQPPVRQPVGCDEYFANAAGFAPVRFDPTQWARAAREAGAQYVVFTAKHHDGFAMFDTRVSDYSVVAHSRYGKDITEQLVEAFRSEGLRIGLYFSIVDWHHPDYPRYTDDTVPKPYVVGDYPRGTAEQWQRYRAFMLAQLRELLTGYGPIDVVWLDGEFEHSESEWNFAEIRALIRELQPAALVNDRCLGHGDFSTPEQQLPLGDAEGLWECCMTMNSSWGYSAEDGDWKSARALLHVLVETVAAGGNLLLNVGPDGDGLFPAEAVDRLSALADWMTERRESVIGVQPGLQLWQFHGPTTRRRIADGGQRIYLHLIMRPYEEVAIRGVPLRRVRGVRVLGGRELDWVENVRLDDARTGADDPIGELVIGIAEDDLNELCTVIAIDLESPVSTEGNDR